MINSYRQLTGKYLRANKKRSMLTIIGIVLSVALISSIGLFFKALQVAQVEDAKNSYGSQHLIFKNADEDLISKINNNPKVSRSGIYFEGEQFKLENGLDLQEIVTTDKAMELLPFKIKEGKLPENDNEAAIEKWALERISKNTKVGEKIKIKNKEYTLTGVLENSISSQVDGIAPILIKTNNINKKESVVLLEISSKTNLKKAVSELKQLAKPENVQVNEMLLMMEGAGEGSSTDGLLVTLSIIIGIVAIATIAVIYNSFQISVVERIKQFGLLRAVGTTPKQVRKIVLREATILASIGVPIGLLCGIIAIYGIDLSFKLIGGDSIMPMTPEISPMVLGISALVGLAAIYISALIPAFFAGKISPLVAISSRTSITKEKIKRRKNVIIQKLFGFEGSMAAKNIRRNRKRYRITVFSIVISVVLFITFKSFMDMSLTISTNPNESDNIHFSIYKDGSDKDFEASINNKTIENIGSIQDVDRVYKVYKPYHFQAAINKNSELKEVQDIGTVYKNITISGNEKTLINSSIMVYDKDAIEASKKYLQSGNIDIEAMNKENGVIIIKKNRIFNDEMKKTYMGPVADIKVGDEIELQQINPEDSDEKEVEFGKRDVKKVKVMAILENEPFNFRGFGSGIKIVSTEEVTKKLIGSDTLRIDELNITIKDIKKEEAVKANIESVVKSEGNITLVNQMDGNRRNKSAVLMVKILIYGFVTVISLIGCVNIVNTITTNIILRRREFSALKSIGLTQKGLKKIIVLEGLLYGVVGTLYGSIIGCGLSYLMYSKGMGEVREFAWKAPWDAILIAGIASIVVGYISVLSPLSRIKKDNLIDTIREDF